MQLKAGDKCPYCEVGKLIIKDGRYSRFLGCDMWRHTGCNFAKSLGKEDQKDPLEKQADQILAFNKKEYLII